MAFDSSQSAYKSLQAINAERTSKIVMWCGAGLSVPSGLPTWSQLRGLLQGELLAKVETMGPSGSSLKKRANQIKDEVNPWIAFQRLEAALGSTTYRDTIKEAFRPATSSAVPRSYELIWRIPNLAGILNLNLDRLATRSFTEQHQPRTHRLSEFDSTRVGDYVHVLRSPNPFIYNMHGTEQNAHSWVLTQKQITRLLENEQYLTFVRSVLTTYTVVFVGISADDVAVGSHLEQITKLGLDIASHFWITDRGDLRTDRWAEKSHIRMIRYRNIEGHHEELLECLAGLVSPDASEESNNYDPVRPTIEGVRESMEGQLPSPDSLISLPANELRFLLNEYAAEILKVDSPASFMEYARFCEDYAEPVYRAWFVTDRPGMNQLFSYRLDRHVAQGSFGDVYQGYDDKGNPRAVKVLKHQVGADPDLLKCFRRGVKAMRILADQKVEGMVAYREASEIPAFVVMDWIDGLNIREAVEAQLLETWDDILNVSVQLSSIIQRAHALPQRVLHRDLRPENVMVKNFWTLDDLEVVVLDFDLSWHQGAYEQSTMHGSGTGGYWAPEQIERVGKTSTKHGAVDSFGLGMLLYFVISGNDPNPNNQRQAKWPEDVYRAARKVSGRSWKSLPNRFGKLILQATKDGQSERIDVTEIHNELLRLRAAWLEPSSVRDPDLLAHEIAARADSMMGFVWEDDSQSAIMESPAGLKIVVQGVETGQLVRLEFVQIKESHQEFKRAAGRARHAATDATISALDDGRWNVVFTGVGATGLRVVATLDPDVARDDLDAAARALDKAARSIKFE